MRRMDVCRSCGHFAVNYRGTADSRYLCFLVIRSKRLLTVETVCPYFLEIISVLRNEYLFEFICGVFLVERVVL